MTPDDPNRVGNLDHDPCREYDQRWQVGQDTQDERRNAAVYEGDLAADCAAAVDMRPSTIRTGGEIMAETFRQFESIFGESR